MVRIAPSTNRSGGARNFIESGQKIWPQIHMQIHFYDLFIFRIYSRIENIKNKIKQC